MTYKETYSKLDIYRELLVNRYMLTTLLTNVYSLMETLKERDTILSKEFDKATKRRLRKANDNLSLIEFDGFSLTSKQHQALINQYGVEVVAEACVIFSKHIAKTGKTYAHPYQKIKDWAIKLALQERLSDYADSIILSTKEIDYHIIDNKELAYKYYYATPAWKRNIDEGCIYLAQKFEIVEPKNT